MPCRNQIFEILLAEAFSLKFPVTVGPNVTMFKNFQKVWSDIDQKSYELDLERIKLYPILYAKIDSINAYIDGILKKDFTRDDYKELLILAKIFIGKIPVDKVVFRKPGACHHARWMAKAIYALKIFFFRKSFGLSKQQEQKIFEVSLFVVFIYLEAWFTAPLPIKAPNHDLKFLKKT